MEIVAQVFDWKITKTELDFEENQIKKQFPEIAHSDIRICAIHQLIDRYLLMHEAINHGICINDDELEDAMFDLLDNIWFKLELISCSPRHRVSMPASTDKTIESF